MLVLLCHLVVSVFVFELLVFHVPMRFVLRRLQWGIPPIDLTSRIKLQMTKKQTRRNSTTIAALAAFTLTLSASISFGQSSTWALGDGFPSQEECVVLLPETTRTICADPCAAPGNLGLFTRHENVNDRIIGALGGENIFGGRGNDVLTGGGGGDFFHFEGAYMHDGDHDFITDFELLRDKLTSTDSAILVGCKVDCEGNVVLCLESAWAANPATMKVTLLGVTKEDVYIAAECLCINTDDGLSQEELQHLFGRSGPFEDCGGESGGEGEGEECEVVLPETTRDIFANVDVAPENLGLETRDENVNDNIVGSWRGENIFGGRGSDILTGNAGGDFFHFEGAHMNDGDHDFITDFDPLFDRLTSQDSSTLVGYRFDCEGNVVLEVQSTWPENPATMEVTLLGFDEEDFLFTAEAFGFDASDGISLFELRAMFG